LPHAETAAAVPPPVVAKTRGGGVTVNWSRMAIVVLAVAAVGAGGMYASRVYRKPVETPLGTLSVQTNPPGAGVFVDGVAYGNTPARISLKAGSHILELRGRGVPRSIPVSITGGA